MLFDKKCISIPALNYTKALLSTSYFWLPGVVKQFCTEKIKHHKLSHHCFLKLNLATHATRKKTVSGNTIRSKDDDKIAD